MISSYTKQLPEWILKMAFKSAVNILTWPAFKVQWETFSMKRAKRFQNEKSVAIATLWELAHTTWEVHFQNVSKKTMYTAGMQQTPK